jgi:hypothetical protein
MAEASTRDDVIASHETAGIAAASDRCQALVIAGMVGTCHVISGKGGAHGRGDSS